MKTQGLSIVCLAVILTFTTLGRAEIDPDTIAGLWLFDEGKGDTALDSSGNGYDGILEGDPAWVDGRFGTALEFTGSDYVELQNSAAGLPFGGVEPFTITAWVKNQGGGTIVGKFNGGVIGAYILSVGGGGGITFHREVAPLVAAQSPDVAYIVLMAGVGTSLEEGIHLQTEAYYRLAGASEEAIALNRTINQRIFDLLRVEKDDSVAEGKISEILEELNPQVAKLSEEDRRKVELSYPLKFDSYKGFLSPGARHDFFHDPRAALMKVKCPVLAIIGEKDKQVPPKPNLEEIEKALESGGNEDYTVKELPGLNHLFQTAETGAESEYAKIEETISPVALELISGWILERTGIGSGSVR